MIDQQLGKELRAQIPKTTPDFARQRRELLQSIQLTLVERAAGKSMEDELSKMFQEASTQLRVPAGGAAAGGVAPTLAPLSTATRAGRNGIPARAIAAPGALLPFSETRENPRAHPT